MNLICTRVKRVGIRLVCRRLKKAKIGFICTRIKNTGIDLVCTRIRKAGTGLVWPRIKKGKLRFDFVCLRIKKKGRHRFGFVWSRIKKADIGLHRFGVRKSQKVRLRYCKQVAPILCWASPLHKDAVSVFLIPNDRMFQWLGINAYITDRKG